LNGAVLLNVRNLGIMFPMPLGTTDVEILGYRSEGSFNIAMPTVVACTYGPTDFLTPGFLVIMGIEKTSGLTRNFGRCFLNDSNEIVELIT
jgi:hypothetical protein